MRPGGPRPEEPPLSEPTLAAVGELTAEQLRGNAEAMSLAEAQRLADATVVVPIDTLRLHPKNANLGNVEAIRGSVQSHGLYRTVVVQKSTGHLLAGNHTWKAAKAEGRTHLAVIELDVDDAEAVRILLDDNRSAELGGGYDNRLLAELLGDLPDLTGTLWTGPELDDLLENLGDELLGGGLDDRGELPEHDDTAESSRDDATTDPAPEDDEDAGGELLALADISVAPPRHQVTTGQVWTMGPHLLAVYNVHTAWAQWVDLLTPGAILLPYPGPMAALTEKAGTTQLVLVQPDAYLAGHCLDKYAAVHGADSVRLRP